MRSILVLLEDLVREEFGDRDLEAARALAATWAGAPAVEDEPAARMANFVRAIAEVRKRPLSEVQTFLAMRLVGSAIK